MSTRSLAAAAVSAALLAGALHAAPSVEITNVQQQYPWTNTVDITYTVQGVKTHQVDKIQLTNETYFVTFEAKDSSGNPIRDTAGNTVFTNGLVNGSVTETAQWQPVNNLQLVANTLTPSVFRGEENAYLVINLETNKQGKCDWWYEPMSTQEASNKRYNTDLYKTKYMVLRKVYPGTYQNGHSVYANTWPKNSPHNVVVPADTCFYAGVFPVTIAQYQRVMGTSYSSTDTRPQANVSWLTLRNSAGPLAKIEGNLENRTSFFVRLTGLTDLPCDLPTEAMSEIARRAGAKTAFFWGDSFDNAYCWYKDTSTHGKVKNVGLKKPNNWGLFDECGCIWEWCLDTYNEGDIKTWATNASFSVYTPYTGGSANNKSRRGVVNWDPISSMRASYRGGGSAANMADTWIGLRVFIIFNN